jgi:hypothetical protein
MRRFRSSLTIAAAFAAIAVLGASTAHAVPIYEWEYSVDGGAFHVLAVIGTANAGTGNAIGGTSPGVPADLSFSINTSSNNPGSPALANLFNTTENVINASGSTHTVTIEVTETDFTAPTGAGNLFAIVGPVSVRQTNPADGVASATFSATAGYLASSNTAFDTSGFATTSFSGSGSSSGIPTVISPGTFEFSPSNPFTPSKPFSMTVTNTVVLGANSSAHIEISDNFTPAAVPEPSTLALAGIGALGLIGYGLRRRKALGA